MLRSTLSKTLDPVCISTQTSDLWEGIHVSIVVMFL